MDSSFKARIAALDVVPWNLTNSKSSLSGWRRVARCPHRMDCRDSQSDLKCVHAGVAEWQTRRTQNPLVARPCGFDSLLRHHVLANVYRCFDTRAIDCAQSVSTFSGLPGTANLFIKVPLTARNPRSVVLLSDFDVLMPQQNRYVLHTDALL